MADGKALTGDILGAVAGAAGKGGGVVPAAAGFQALTNLVAAAQDCVVTMAQEQTKQSRLAAYRDTEVAKIRAAESVLKKYFDETFAERRANIDGLFERLDRALEAGDSTQVGQMVTAVVDLAKSSPLNDLGDLSQIRAALDDPDQVWDL
ncbi:MAG: hypothetical protein WAW85_12880 [Gordonia sp. (in: high G+C Gram-positive bacteria)]|uniref:hypothetical protein n=1 Tax=Gordonia sp. (in: high G+C Gram-positive bacteria) TaxID=84139 RepID=UPI003BB77452